MRNPAAAIRCVRAASVGWLVLTVALLAGCGLPTHSDAVRMSPSDVPHGLESPWGLMGPTSTTAISGHSPPTRRDTAQAYFVTAASRLLPMTIQLSPGADITRQVTTVLERLVAGPSAADREHGLSTEIPPGSRLTVASIRDGTVQLEWRTLSDGLEPRRASLAAGQVVLSVTSVRGIERVQILRDGAPADVPLPEGELKTEPLTGFDFDTLTHVTTPGTAAVG